ncbi:MULTISPECIES: hypothetical protein [unclassified Campylobacter]|uniref:hypothetical protein n=1 Tax=unclassified Campylobacter TaxID=2593542 RepID=UPI0022E9AA52|nr:MULTISPECIES: hypothetical protein [unclassified Campylobacter]MDA3062253.1 hypothetical protein [Campylobacter sp. JMF_14 EL1]MDA3073628.1 hypothetical protein [Campylobacter sp. JMF_10 EL2]
MAEPKNPSVFRFIFSSFINALIVLGLCGVIFYLAHPDFLALSKHGGFEAEILYLYIGISLCLLACGGGKFSVARD